MNLSVSSLVLSRVTEKGPMLNKQLKFFELSKSRISKSMASIKLNSQHSFLKNNKFSDFLSTTIKLDSNLEHTAIGVPTRINDIFFVARGCHFVNCKSEDNGGAFCNNKDQSVIRFEECHFINCQTYGEGGGIFSKQGSFYLVDSLFEDCHANIGAQCALIHGDMYSIITLTRNTFIDCPQRPPDASGSVVKLILGMQKLNDVNFTRNEMITGSGSYLAYQPYYHRAKYCIVQDTKATNSLIINTDPRNSSAPTISNSIFINNYCDMPYVVFTTGQAFFIDCVIFNNDVGEFIDDPVSKDVKKDTAETKNNAFRSDDTNNATIKSEEQRRKHKRVHNFAEFINCKISAESRILREASITNCKTINADSLGEISMLQQPVLPQVPPRTPVSQFHFASGYVLLLCPIFTVIVLLIGLLIQTSNFTDFESDVYV